MKALLALLGLFNVAAASPSSDEAAIRAAEAIWHGAATAESVSNLLADDFVMPMPNGLIWSKKHQGVWLRDPPVPAGFIGKTERLDVRIYGDAAVATGVAVILNPAGQEVDATIFTDVYVKRGGKWLMVSAQRGPVQRVKAID